jgi:hypothetical protein
LSLQTTFQKYAGNASRNGDSMQAAPVAQHTTTRARLEKQRRGGKQASIKPVIGQDYFRWHRRNQSTF